MMMNTTKKHFSMTRKRFEILAIAFEILLLIAFYFLLVVSFPMQEYQNQSRLEQIPVFTDSEKQEILSHIATIEETIQIQNDILQQSSVDIQKFTNELEAMNLAFLSWAEKQGLISRVN